MATFRARNETLRGRPAVSLLEQPTRVFNSRGWSAMGNIMEWSAAFTDSEVGL